MEGALLQARCWDLCRPWAAGTGARAGLGVRVCLAIRGARWATATKQAMSSTIQAGSCARGSPAPVSFFF